MLWCSNGHIGRVDRVGWKERSRCMLHTSACREDADSTPESLELLRKFTDVITRTLSYTDGLPSHHDSMFTTLLQMHTCAQSGT